VSEFTLARGDELKLENQFVSWLRENGWTEISQSHGKRGTPDITAVSPTGKKVIFEVKADRPKGDGRKTDERSVDYPTLIGQICTRMLDESVEYAIVISKEGLPWFKARMPRIPLERLQLRISVVNDSIQELNHDYNFLKCPEPTRNSTS